MKDQGQLGDKLVAANTALERAQVAMKVVKRMMTI
jgi:hypothetical protein